MSLQNQFRPPNPRLGTHYAILASLIAALLIVLALLEQLGARKLWLSHTMIVVPLLLYLTVSAFTRTLDLHQFFSVSRRIPPVFGGLAFAATTIGCVGLFSFTGSLFLMGFDALAFAIGWIAGFTIAGMMFVPFLRKAGAYTLPGFFRLRFSSPLSGAIAALLVLPPSIILLAAELRIGAFVTSLFASVSFEVAVICGALLIIAVLVLGGLRSLTWTQSVQYTVALAGILVPLIIVSVQQMNLPLPQLTYGWLLEQLSINELALGTGRTSPLTLLGGIPGERPEPALKAFLQPFGALTRGDFALLTFCIMTGTAAMPALLLRAGTTTHTHQSRRLVGWSTVFLGLFLITAPAYAVFAKHLTLLEIAGTAPRALPAWITGLRDTGLADIGDKNADGVIGASELFMSRDGVVLSLPIMAGLPFIFVVFVATAGIAAALAAGAAQTFAAGSAVSDDLFHGIVGRSATPGKRLLVARISMVVLTLLAAWYVTTNDFDVLRALIAALSLSGAAFLPALVLSVFWKRTTKWGVIAAMLSGTVVAAGHMALQLTGAGFFLPGLSGLLAAALGIPVGIVAGVAASLLTSAPTKEIDALADDMRDPSGEALFDKAMRLSIIRNRPSLPGAVEQVAAGSASDGTP
jgi:cation/acetate symporter